MVSVLSVNDVRQSLRLETKQGDPKGYVLECFHARSDLLYLILIIKQ